MNAEMTPQTPPTEPPSAPDRPASQSPKTTSRSKLGLRIKRLTIRGFRQLRELEIADPEHAIAVFGRNGAGKSSLIYAVQMLLRGACPLTAANGAGAEPLIHDDFNQADIEADMDNYRLSMTLYRAGKKKKDWSACDLETGEMIAESPAEFWTHLGVKAKHAAVAVAPHDYLFSADLGGILADLFVGEIDAVRLMDDVPTEHREWISRKLPTPLTAATLQAFGKKLAERRTEQSALLKAAKVRVDDIGLVVAPTDAKGRRRELSEQAGIAAALRGLHRDRDAMIAERARAESATTPEEIARLTAASDEAHALCVASANTRNEANRVEIAARQACEKTLARMSRISAALASLKTIADACPTCGQKITTEARAAMTAPLLAEQVEAAAEHTTLAAAHDAAKEVRARRESEHEEVYRAALAATEALKAAVPPTRPVVDIDADITAVDEKIARGEALIAQMNRYAEYLAAQADMERLTTEHDHLDWAVLAFRDGALVKELMGSGLDDFTDRANQELSLFGHSLSVSVTGKNVTVLLDGRDIKHHSRGRQALAAFAIATAFADLSGAPVVLDDINDLDEENWATIMQRIGDLGQSVLLGGTWTGQDIDAMRASLGGVSVCWVGDPA